MYELPREIPIELLLALEPEELAAKMLLWMRNRNERMYRLGNLESELWQPSSNPNQPRYPFDKREVIGLVLREAWAWLEAQGLLIPAEGANGEGGWRVLSRRA